MVESLEFRLYNMHLILRVAWITLSYYMNTVNFRSICSVKKTNISSEFFWKWESIGGAHPEWKRMCWYIYIRVENREHQIENIYILFTFRLWVLWKSKPIAYCTVEYICGTQPMARVPPFSFSKPFEETPLTNHIVCTYSDDY